MKRRTAKKMEAYKYLPHRLTNKYMYLTFWIKEYWSLQLGPKVYIHAIDGRIAIYSYYNKKVGEWCYGPGKKLWDNDD